MINKLYQDTTDEIRAALNDGFMKKFLMLQGFVLQLQQKSGERIEFELEVFNNIQEMKKCIDDIEYDINEITNQINYMKDLLDGMETSQRMSEGYSDFKMKEVENRKKLAEELRSYRNYISPLMNS